MYDDAYVSVRFETAEGVLKILEEQFEESRGDGTTEWFERSYLLADLIRSLKDSLEIDMDEVEEDEE